MDLVSYFPALFVTLLKKGFLSHNDWNQHAYLRHMGREYVFFLQSSWDFPLIPGEILEQSPSHHHKISSEEEVSIAQAPNFRKEAGIASGVIIIVNDERDIYSLYSRYSDRSFRLFLSTFEPFTLISNTFL